MGDLGRVLYDEATNPQFSELAHKERGFYARPAGMMVFGVVSLSALTVALVWSGAPLDLPVIAMTLLVSMVGVIMASHYVRQVRHQESLRVHQGAFVWTDRATGKERVWRFESVDSIILWPQSGTVWVKFRQGMKPSKWLDDELWLADKQSVGDFGRFWGIVTDAAKERAIPVRAENPRGRRTRGP
jgi:hypothetical protein